MINRSTKWVDINKHQASPLQQAIAHKKRLSFIQNLIKKRANLNYQDRYGKTALHYAISAQRNDIIEELVKAKANVYLKEDKGLTPLMAIATDTRPGRLTTLRAFFKNQLPAERIQAINEGGNASLLLACRRADKIIVKELIENRADINYIDLENKTALHYAIHDNNIPMLNTLLSYGANTDHPTLLRLAVECNSSLSLIQLLIKKNVNINHQESICRRTALHYAVFYKKNDIIVELIKAGANVHLKDEFGLTPLMHIIQKPHEPGQLETLRTFCKSLSIPTRIRALNDTSNDILRGGTVLQMATRTNGRYTLIEKDQVADPDWVDLEVVKELIDNGADMDHIDSQGYTILYHAIYYNINLVKTLLDKGADTNLGVKTPLCEAIACSFLPDQAGIVEMLLQKGADPNQLQKNKTTALDLALSHANDKRFHFIPPLLISYGATITNFEAFYNFMCLQYSILFYEIFLDTKSVPIKNIINHLDENKVFEVITGFQALLSQLKKQQISFSHEMEVRIVLQELRKIAIEYRKKIAIAINQTTKINLPTDITGIVSDYLGCKKSFNILEPQPQKAIHYDDDKPVYFHYACGKKSHYPFLFSGTNNHLTGDKVVPRGASINLKIEKK